MERRSARPTALPLNVGSAQFCSDSVHQALSDAGIEGIVDLTNAGRAGNVDLGKEITDHVQSDEKQAAFA